MPNRILKESIRTSKSVNAMTDFQFRLWAYLITYVDDYGRGSADPELLKGFVFPRRKGISEATIEKTLRELASLGSIQLYEVEGESYLVFPGWQDHQSPRAKVSKFPAPPECNRTCMQMQADACTCKQTQADAPDIRYSRIDNDNRYSRTDKRAPARFAPPTEDDVKAYADEMGYAGFNSASFVAYYEANGWKVGRNPMKDWKAAVRGWHSRDGQRQQTAVKTNPATDYQQRDYKQQDEDSFFLDLAKEFGGENDG